MPMALQPLSEGAEEGEDAERCDEAAQENGVKAAEVVVQESMTEWDAANEATLQALHSASFSHSERSEATEPETNPGAASFEQLCEQMLVGCDPPMLSSRISFADRAAVALFALTPLRVHADRERAEFLARRSMADNEAAHARALSCVFCRLTGEKECARLGSHWSRIGFQGSDPSTDLRSAGSLGILHLLHFVCFSTSTARRMLALSTSEKRAFPLAAISINMSVISLKAMRRGYVDGWALARRDYLKATCELHEVLMTRLLQIYEDRGLSVKDAGRVRSTLEAQALSCVGIVRLRLQLRRSW